MFSEKIKHTSLFHEGEKHIENLTDWFPRSDKEFCLTAFSHNKITENI